MLPPPAFDKAQVAVGVVRDADAVFAERDRAGFASCAEGVRGEVGAAGDAGEVRRVQGDVEAGVEGVRVVSHGD